jgi:hypothetical protein
VFYEHGSKLRRSTTWERAHQMGRPVQFDCRLQGFREWLPLVVVIPPFVALGEQYLGKLNHRHVFELTQ